MNREIGWKTGGRRSTNSPELFTAPELDHDDLRYFADAFEKLMRRTYVDSWIALRFETISAASTKPRPDIRAPSLRTESYVHRFAATSQSNSKVNTIGKRIILDTQPARPR